jgi:integrase
MRRDHGGEAPERREFGYIYKRGATYWIRYSVGGRRYRESSGSTKIEKAEKLLARREAELSVGHLVTPAAKRFAFRDLAELLRNDYRVQGRRTLTVQVVNGKETFGGTLAASLAHLTAFFGASPALGITSDRVTAYERQRLEAGAARATINKELAALRRAFNLAVKAKRLPLSAKPAISTPKPANARHGFFEPEDFAAVLAELPAPLRPLFQVAYWTGWRVADELVPLRWPQVDFDAGELRLDPNTAKTPDGRTFPFGVLPALQALLERQRAITRTVERRTGQLVPYVFHRDGKPIRSYYDAWRSACTRAASRTRNGLAVLVRPQVLGRVPHDFRRTAARNLIRAGVAQHVVMKLCGWKTDDMFRRYAIVDTRDLRDAVAALARGTSGAQRRRSAAGRGQ